MIGIATCIVICLLIIPFFIMVNEPVFESYIEERLYWKLIERGYNPKTQVRCGHYRIDMVIGNVAIECDGKAFHSSPAQKKYDRNRSSYLYRNGYRSVLRFSGSDINKNLYRCISKIEGAIGK